MPERPGYSRSKSGLSRLSMLAKSMEDIHTIKKPEKDKKEKDKDKDKDMEPDASDGKKSGLLGFKSPFKKNKKAAYSKHSDESETSSLDSLNLEDRTNALRGKKDRLSDRSNDSASRIEPKRKISNGSLGLPTGIRQIDTSQLLADIHLSLANQSSDMSKSPSIHSGEFVHVQRANTEPEVFSYEDYKNEVGNQQPSQIQIDFIQKLIDEAMEENRDAFHRDIVNLQVEMIRQMEIQKEQIRQMIHNDSINGDLVMEIRRLRVENERLRTKY